MTVTALETMIRDTAAANVQTAMRAAGLQKEARDILQLPFGFQDEVACYVIFGAALHDPLIEAVVVGDLYAAMKFSADETYPAKALSEVRDLSLYFAERAPKGCAGSAHNRQRWHARGGLLGAKA